jgi:Flp pilus assembly protein TadG
MKLLSDDRGQSVIEMALVCLLLVLMLFSVVEGGRLLYTYHYLAYAARRGSRYAMVRGASCDSSNGMPTCPLAVPDGQQVQAYIRAQAYPGIDASQVNATVTWGPSPSETSCSTANCNGPGDEVTVNTAYLFNTIVLPIQFSLSLGSTSQRIISQ